MALNLDFPPKTNVKAVPNRLSRSAESIWKALQARKWEGFASKFLPSQAQGSLPAALRTFDNVYVVNVYTLRVYVARDVITLTSIRTKGIR